ncbi:MAG: hypothetical protein LBD02_02495 [Christensenellaceae bacterium]|jgi:hypothetical protein|nr:hypothetical protein [Christensenellaceae bacterium]
MIYLSAKLIPFLLPFLVTLPAYIGGRLLWFKGIAQAEMHLHKKGRLFTAGIGLLHLAATVALALAMF